MIKAHKIKLLQAVFSLIWDNVDAVNSKLDWGPEKITEDTLEETDLLMSLILEQVALWRATKAELFNENKGVKIRD